jgi:hypothetical protein
MYGDPVVFGLRLMNIPTLNLRYEFQDIRMSVSDDAFVSQLGEPGPHLLAPLKWAFSRDAYMTLLLQRTILGLEAYLPSAVLYEATARGRPLRETLDLTKNPFRLGGRGTAENYYNRLPALVEPDVALSNARPALWPVTSAFYQQVRNPIFHGDQLFEVSVDAFRKALDLISGLYEWVDSWHSLEHSFSPAGHPRPTPSPRTGNTGSGPPKP